MVKVAPLSPGRTRVELLPTLEADLDLADVEDAKEEEEESLPGCASGTKQRTRVLLFALPMYGHVLPLSRLADWFAKQPSEYETFLCIGNDGLSADKQGKLLQLVPSGCHGYIHDGGRVLGALGVQCPLGERYEQRSCQSTNLIDQTYADIVESAQPSAVSAHWLAVGMVNEIRSKSPKLVISDAGFYGMMYAHPVSLCLQLGIKMLSIVPQSRPDPMLSPSLQIRLVLHSMRKANTSVIVRSFARMHSSIRATSKECAHQPAWGQGVLSATHFASHGVPKPHPPLLQLYPGSANLVPQKSIRKDALYTTPWFPLPPPKTKAEAFDDQGTMGKELRGWLDANPDEPVLYVAFGTITSMRPGAAEKIFQGLSSCKCRVLWSLPLKEQQQLSEQARVNTLAWRLEVLVPQRHVLCHPHVCAFFSHCGANSSLEALAAGVPMLCMPTLGDQFAWRDVVCKRRAGLPLHKFTFTAAQLRQAVTLLTDPKEGARFRRAAEAIADSMRREANELLERFGCKEGPELEKMSAGVRVAAAVCLQLLSS